MKRFCLILLFVFQECAGSPNLFGGDVPLNRKQKERLAEGDKYLEAAQEYRRAGKLAEAIVAEEKLLSIEREVFGHEHKDVAVTLQALASLRERVLDFAGAAKDRSEILRIRIKCCGEKSWQVRDARLDLQALDVLKGLGGKAHEELKLAHQWQQEAMHCHSEGNYLEAAKFAEKALAVRQRWLGENNRLQSMDSAYWLGLSLSDAGQLKRARLENSRLLTIRRKILGEDHPDTAASWNNLGLCLSGEGDLAAARPCYEKALRIYKTTLGEEDPDTVNPLSNLGNLLSEQGDFAAARTCYEQVLAIRKKVFGEEDPTTADSLNNLGTLLNDMGDDAAAQACYERALAIRRKALGDEHIKVAGSLNNLGILSMDRGDYATARSYYEQALAIWKKKAGANHPYVALSLVNLGNLSFRQGKYLDARPYLEKALAIQKKTLGEQHPDIANTLEGLGLVCARLRDSVAALDFLDRALILSHRHLTLNANGQSEREQLLMVQMHRNHLDAYLSVSAAGKDNAPSDYAHVLAWKGSILARQQRLRLARLDPKLGPLLAELSAATDALATLSTVVPSGAEPERVWAKQLRDLSARQQDLERELVAKSAAFRKDQAQTNLTPAQLLKALPRDVVLIDYVVYYHARTGPVDKGESFEEQRLTAFVLRTGMEIVRLDLGPMEPINQAIDAWRRSLKSQPGKDHPGMMLRRRLWLPVEKHLGDAKVVLISPDGALGRLPFVALPGRNEGTYLLEDIALAQVPVPRLLPELVHRPEEKVTDISPSLLLVGDVDFNAAAGTVMAKGGGLAPTRTSKFEKWQALDGTRGEIVAIRDSFERKYRKGKVTMLREDNATDAAVLEEAVRHRFLHIASHGFFAPEEVPSALADGTSGRHMSGSHAGGKRGAIGYHPGLLSGLVLAGANRPPQPGQGDGILTALEVAELDLRYVELAVLSACETGLGKAAGGEGVLGLQRSFQIAGARSVVASLWKVPDDQTRKLMTRFYANFWHKTSPMSKLEALREAQLYMLREGGIRGLVEDDAKDQPRLLRAPPYYWAAFVLSGDWR